MGGSGVVPDVDTAKKLEAEQKQKIMTKLVQMRHSLGVAIDKLQAGSVADLKLHFQSENVIVGDRYAIGKELFGDDEESWIDDRRYQ